jgi:asparagine synthase (glutamine-hydrolysing)
MCGFLGYIGPDGLGENTFRDILALSRHRGPDSSGIHRSGGDMYGFNRLAIQDLSEIGNQPMVSADGKRVLLFNGEVYNHLRLREKYGITGCKGHGDTETLFHLFKAGHFASVVPELDGMFAISWADYDKGELWLARDMAGIKPLYYHAGECIAFASQLNQVLKLPGVSHDLSADSVADYLRLGYMPAPNTVFRHVHQLLPGQILSFDMRSRRLTSSVRYYVFGRDAGAEPGIDTKDLKHILEGSVRDQLVSDVSLATFMSGGIDSPIINAIAKHSKPDLTAFTFRNRYDASIDESSIANALSDSIGLSYRNVEYSNDDVLEAIDSQFRYLSEPLGDFSTIPTFFICRAAKSSATVMLSGDGGDELFYGYRRHLEFLRDQSLFRYPGFVRAAYSRLRVMGGGPRVSNAVRYHTDPGSAYLDAQSFMRPATVASLMGGHRMSDAVADIFSLGGASSPRQVADVITKADYYGFLQMVLRKVDLMSMASSVEVRVPFLCRGVIDAARGYEPSMVTAADLKRPLKEIFSGCYPGGKTFHRKIGFTIAIGSLLRGPLRDDLLLHTCQRPVYGSGLIDAGRVASFVQDYLQERHSEHQSVWHLYAWQKWAYLHEMTT